MTEIKVEVKKARVRPSNREVRVLTATITGDSGYVDGPYISLKDVNEVQRPFEVSLAVDT